MALKRTSQRIGIGFRFLHLNLLHRHQHSLLQRELLDKNFQHSKKGMLKEDMLEFLLTKFQSLTVDRPGFLNCCLNSQLQISNVLFEEQSEETTEDKDQKLKEEHS